RHPALAANEIHTRFVEEHAAELVSSSRDEHRRLFFESSTARPVQGLAGARLDTTDPLAVLEHGKSPAARRGGASTTAEPSGTVVVRAHMQGTVVAIETHEGEAVRAGQPLLVMEAMKMEHVIASETSGIVRRITVGAGDTVVEGHALAFVEESTIDVEARATTAGVDLDRVRPDLQEAHERHAVGLDAARPDAVARRRKTGQRTARENVEDLCDPGTFVEYGPLVVAAQRRRRTVEDLIQRTPADG